MSVQSYGNEQAWIEALKDGKTDAWGGVPSAETQEPASGLLGLFFRWGKKDIQDDDIAKDIALEAGSRVVRYLKNFRAEVSFMQWLRRIYTSVLYRRVPAFQYKLRAKMEKWLKTYEQRGLEQRRFTEQTLGELSSLEHKILLHLKHGKNIDQISDELGLTWSITRSLKNQAISSFLENKEFMAMISRVGNQRGNKRDKLAANIMAAVQELQELYIEDLVSEAQIEGNQLDAWDTIAQPKSESETDLSDWMALFWECVAKLSPLRQEIILITLQYRSGSPAETNIDESIAQELGITPRLVRLRRFQANKPLKECLEKIT